MKVDNATFIETMKDTHIGPVETIFKNLVGLMYTWNKVLRVIWRRQANSITPYIVFIVVAATSYHISLIFVLT